MKRLSILLLFCLLMAGQSHAHDSSWYNKISLNTRFVDADLSNELQVPSFASFRHQYFTISIGYEFRPQHHVLVGYFQSFKEYAYDERAFYAGPGAKAYSNVSQFKGLSLGFQREVQLPWRMYLSFGTDLNLVSGNGERHLEIFGFDLEYREDWNTKFNKVGLQNYLLLGVHLDRKERISVSASLDLAQLYWEKRTLKLSEPNKSSALSTTWLAKVDIGRSMGINLRYRFK